MSLIDDLKSEYPEISDWKIEETDRKEKERINQSTETIRFTATAPDKAQQRRFIYTNFTDHRGSKISWREDD